jgi:putative two-component system response regulator
LHDIGKLAVPEHILAKPGPLTPEEFQKVRHPSADRRRDHRLGAVSLSGRAAHSEPPRALDGNGYPAGRKGEQVPLGRASGH